MSIPPQEAAALIAAYNTDIVGADATFGCLALVLYEYVITFKYEVDFLWRRKWSLATWLFIFIRYATVGILMVTVIPQQAQCNNGLAIYLKVLMYTLSTLFAATSAIRVFALLTQPGIRFLVSGLVFALGLLKPGISVYINAHQYDVPVTLPIIGQLCSTVTTGISDNVRYKFGIAATVAPIATDCMVLIVTWYKTIRQVTRASSLGMNLGLSGILLRDGSIFFLMTLALTIVSSIPTPSAVLNVVEAFSFFLQPVLIMRFLINLRQAGTVSSIPTETGTKTQFSSPQFRAAPVNSMIGTMGAPLDYDDDNILDDEDFEPRVGRNTVESYILDQGDSDEGSYNKDCWDKIP